MAGGMGALIGTFTLAVAIPVAQPLIYMLGSPQLAVIILWGLTMIAVVSGRDPLKGIIAAAFGLLLSTIGQQVQSGVARYIFNQLYLLDGLALSIVAVAMFGVPAALNLSLTKVGIEQQAMPLKGSILDGIKDTLREWWLVLRCSFLGVWVGIIPGVGAQTVDWLAYGHAAQTCKGAEGTFGKGDVRGVIAPESANDAKDGGDLMSVLLLGIPQGTSTALFIGALLAWGFVPGPEMVRKHADVIFSIIWIQGSSGILGTLIGFVLANQLAKLAEVRYTILVPLILSFVLLGAFSVNRDPLDLLTVVSFGVLGYFMWRLGYPRPAMILGFVLGILFEKYLYRSVMSYELMWLLWPSVIVLLILALGSLALTLWSRREKKGAAAPDHALERRGLTLRFRPVSLLTFFFLALFAAAVVLGWEWPLIAKMMPVYVVAAPGFILAAIQLFREVTGWERKGGQASAGYEADEVFAIRLERRTEVRRTLAFFGWFAGGAMAIWLLGTVIALPLFMLLYTLIEGKERWRVSLLMSASALLFVWGLFEYILEIRWPPGVLLR
ncbi:MAG: tripartite tricarboxylate transporter permease, partial [Deltaproteobacteria bacterium]|nr:tripartite tricarboxylate transporter permease [Deltaproteobacteria bacterium]